MSGHETMGSRCVIDGRTDDVHKRHGIVVFSFRHTVPSAGLACLVINGTLLAVRGGPVSALTQIQKSTNKHMRAHTELLMHEFISAHARANLHMFSAVRVMGSWRSGQKSDAARTQEQLARRLQVGTLRSYGCHLIGRHSCEASSGMACASTCSCLKTK